MDVVIVLLSHYIYHRCDDFAKSNKQVEGRILKLDLKFLNKRILFKKSEIGEIAYTCRYTTV